MEKSSLDESSSTTGADVIDLDQSPSVVTRRRRNSSSSSQDVQAYPQPITSSNKRKKTRSNDLEDEHDEKEDLSRTAIQNDAEVCSICFEEWTNSGHHRLVATECGHLFGKRLIFLSFQNDFQ